MRIFVLEDDKTRVDYFIAKFGMHDLTITENAFSALEYLDEELYDVLFLDHDLGEGNGCGNDVAKYLEDNLDNRNNDATIIIHSWNAPAAKIMQDKIPQSFFLPFGSKEFFSLTLDN